MAEQFDITDCVDDVSEKDTGKQDVGQSHIRVTNTATSPDTQTLIGRHNESGTGSSIRGIDVSPLLTDSGSMRSDE